MSSDLDSIENHLKKWESAIAKRTPANLEELECIVIEQRQKILAAFFNFLFSVTLEILFKF